MQTYACQARVFVSHYTTGGAAEKGSCAPFPGGDGCYYGGDLRGPAPSTPAEDAGRVSVDRCWTHQLRSAGDHGGQWGLARATREGLNINDIEPGRR